MTRPTPNNMRGTMVPTPLWSAAYVQRLEDEASPQRTGCVYCALGGEAESPRTIYLVNGTSVCAGHITQEQDTDK